MFDARGQRVRTLMDEVVAAGPGVAIWRGEGDDGRQVGSGVYFCRVSGGGEEQILKLTLVK